LVKNGNGGHNSTYFTLHILQVASEKIDGVIKGSFAFRVDLEQAIGVLAQGTVPEATQGACGDMHSG
jgi:hypothetical protein